MSTPEPLGSSEPSESECVVDRGVLDQFKPAGIDSRIEEDRWRTILECPKQSRLIRGIGTMITAAVLDVDTGDPVSPNCAASSPAL